MSNKTSSRGSISFPKLPVDVPALSLEWADDRERFREIFAELQDPRRDHTKRYELMSILQLTFMSILTGGDTWIEVEEFGDAHQDWLIEIGLFTESTPSHDTIGRIFSLLDAKVFARCFAQWVSSGFRHISGVVAIDGKTSRASGDGELTKPIHTVSAYASALGITLAHTAVAEKSNEIAAIPAVLDIITVKDCVVTIDAMGCQKDIAEKIRHGGGDYLLQVKNNQPGTMKELVDFFTDADQCAWKNIPHTTHTTQTTKRTHGRHEIRTATACKPIGTLEKTSSWKDLHQIVRITRQRSIKEKTTNEDHYYITSSTLDAEHLLACARQHWAIENQCHWILDVAFQEDRCRVRKGNAAKNFATVRRFVFNLLRHEQQQLPKRKSIRLLRKRAGWGPGYLITLINKFVHFVSHGE